MSTMKVAVAVAALAAATTGTSLAQQAADASAPKREVTYRELKGILDHAKVDPALRTQIQNDPKLALQKLGYAPDASSVDFLSQASRAGLLNGAGKAPCGEDGDPFGCDAFKP